jgi:hypothetical protein
LINREIKGNNLKERKIESQKKAHHGKIENVTGSV